MSKVVVLVDDDVDDLQLFCEALVEVDHALRCVPLKSGLELLRWTNEPSNTADFIFVDMFMPGMNGLECIQEIRKINRLDGCSVISYSGLVNLKYAPIFNELNASMLIKPDSYDELVDQLRAVIRA